MTTITPTLDVPLDVPPLEVRRRHSTSLSSSTVQVARRAVLRYVRTPQLMVLGTIQGVMFLLIFRYVFGGAIKLPGLSYVDFLVPGFITTGILFTGMGAATVVAEDLQQGFVDRLRSLPIPRLAFLSGRAIADSALGVWSLVLTSAIAFAVGFRLHGSVAAGLAAFGLCLVFAFAFEWLMLTIGLVSGTPQAAQGMAMLVFPLTFVSSAYVPVDTLPGWLQAFATHQPLTYMVDSVRALTEGGAAQALLGRSTGYWVEGALLWSAGILLVFAPLALLRYRRG